MEKIRPWHLKTRGDKPINTIHAYNATQLDIQTVVKILNPSRNPCNIDELFYQRQ